MRSQCDLSVHFLDADGTVFNKNYRAGREKKDLADYSEQNNILTSNAWLVKFIAKQIKLARQGQIESFSMRQSPYAEKDNAGADDTSSFCSALSILHAKLQEETQSCCKLEKYLLADTLNRNEAGEAFEIASRILKYPVSDSPGLPSDILKISMLYAKIQRVVAENPDKENIQITVWDDAGILLKVLCDFFGAHLELIPQKVVLRFMHHKRTDGECFWFGEPLKGKGELNPFYEASLRAFYNSEKYRKFEKAEVEKDPLKIFTPDFQCFADGLCSLHGKALNFSQILDKGVSVSDRRDQYLSDMVACYVKKQKKDLRAIFDGCAKNAIKKADLVAKVLQKINEAKVEEELLSIINFINSPQNRALLEKGEKRTFMHRTTTCDHLIEMARCEMSRIFAKNNRSKSIDNQKEYENFTRYLLLQSGVVKIANIDEPHFFSPTKSPRRRDKTSRKIAQDLHRHGQAVARLCRPGRA